VDMTRPVRVSPKLRLFLSGAEAIAAAAMLWAFVAYGNWILLVLAMAMLWLATAGIVAATKMVKDQPTEQPTDTDPGREHNPT
jgi:small neutral amino acid transporter SnatA (MarC family)